MRNLGRGFLAVLLGGILWMPVVHLLYRPSLDDYWRPRGTASKVRALANQQLEAWSSPPRRAGEASTLRRTNAEWDFMARTFTVLAFANLARRDEGRSAGYLSAMDRIIDETIRLEKERGIYYFLMDYAKADSFKVTPPRSLFQDGEIALMLAARRLAREREDFKPLLGERIRAMHLQMRQSPVLCGESYPDECWMFCNAVAVATMRMADVLDGSDHSAFIRQWLEVMKAKLVDRRTGLPVSSFRQDGTPIEGPEGSTLWMVLHCLKLVDPEYASQLYRRAAGELRGSFLGFGYAREWPGNWRGETDIDSGPVIPVLDASVASSGLAILAAATFEDDGYLRELLTSLSFAGFPMETKGSLRFGAGSLLGDAVLLYALAQGPLWREVDARGARR